MLENYWYILTPSKALKRKPIAVTVFNKALILFRDQGGQAIALEDRCRHRNAPLSCGKVLDDTIQCPYHGWQYSGDGQLAKIPYSCSTPPKLSIPSYPCCEQDGYIWVNIGEVPVSTEPYRFPHLAQPGWTSFRLDTLFNGSVAACLENFLDCPHAMQVHKTWFRTATASPIKAIVSSLKDGAVAEYFNEPREKSVVWSLLTPAAEKMRHTDRFIAPATSQVDYHFAQGRRYIISSCCTPIDEHTTRVHTVINFHYGKLGVLIALFFKPLSLMIINQDVKMLDKQLRNIQRFGETDFSVIPEDLLFNLIARWRQAIKAGTLPPTAGEETHVDMRL